MSPCSFKQCFKLLKTDISRFVGIQKTKEIAHIFLIDENIEVFQPWSQLFDWDILIFICIELLK